MFSRKEGNMKKYHRVLVTVSLVFLSLFANCNETIAWEHSEVCDGAESRFYRIMEIHGWEDGIKSIFTSFHATCYRPFLIRHLDVTEPILREIVRNPDKHSVHLVRSAIGLSSGFGFDDLADEFLKFAHHPERRIRLAAKRAFAETCKPDQFRELLGMMDPEEPDWNSGILGTIRERKVFDPQILIKWRKEEIKNDKQRENKLMRDWFKKELDLTIAVLKEAQK
jgi:hypothetical protein